MIIMSIVKFRTVCITDSCRSLVLLKKLWRLNRPKRKSSLFREVHTYWPKHTCLRAYKHTTTKKSSSLLSLFEGHREDDRCRCLPIRLFSDQSQFFLFRRSLSQSFTTSENTTTCRCNSGGQQTGSGAQQSHLTCRYTTSNGWCRV